MTMGQRDGRESLKFKLSGSDAPLSSWGHEYIRSASSTIRSTSFRDVCLNRNLSGEIGREFSERTDSDEKVDDL